METFSRETSKLEPWYVTGFLERAAAFTYSRNQTGFNIYFAVKSPMADRGLLEQIRSYFGGAGKIYDVGPGAAYYRVSRSAELSAITRHFDGYPLRGSASAAYAVWREMVVAKQRFRQPARARLERLALELSSNRSRNRTRP